MNKKYIIPIIIFFLIFGFSLACTAKSGDVKEETNIETSKEEEPVQQKTYLEESQSAELASFSENIFSFNYPSNWKKVDEQTIDILFQTSMRGGSQSSFDYIGGVYVGDNWEEDIGEAVFVIYTFSDPSFGSTISDEQYQSTKNSFETQYGDRLLSIDKITFQDLSAAEIRSIGKSQKTQAWEIFIIDNGKGYMLGLRAKKELYSDYEPILIDIIDSLKISK